MSPETINKETVLILMSLVLTVGALLNLRNLKSYFLCALIILTPFYATEFMPREVLGVTGLNLWNIVWLIVLVFIVSSTPAVRGVGRRPVFFTPSIIVFLIALLLATMYAMVEIDAFPKIGTGRFTTITVLFTGFLKPVQFLVVGWMVYRYGIATRDTSPVIRSIHVSAIIFGSLVLHYYFVGQSHVDLGDTGGDLLSRNAVSLASGMHVNDIGAWATYALVAAVLSQNQRGFWAYVRYAAIAMSLLAIVLSFSRTAYVTAPLVLLASLAQVKLREKLIALGAAAIVVTLFSPLIVERIGSGLQEKKLDVNNISAGRTETIWGPLLKDFVENPVVGNGRFAQVRSKSYFKLRLTHAHSLYLQILIEMGIVGMIIVLAVIARLYLVGRKSGTPLSYLVFALLLEGIPGHSFYPDASNSLIWVFYGLSLAALAIPSMQARQESRPLAVSGR
jgi:O-antigen ligase